jgi:hypothetical protein
MIFRVENKPKVLLRQNVLAKIILAEHTYSGFDFKYSRDYNFTPRWKQRDISSICLQKGTTPLTSNGRSLAATLSTFCNAMKSS